MILKRIAALAAAVVLVLGALAIRRVMDGGVDRDGTVTPEPSSATELVCTTELAAVCRSIVVEGLSIRFEEAGATLDRLAGNDGVDAPIWLTFDPFPAAVATIRERQRRTPVGFTTAALASSRIALVLDRADSSVDECGDPVEWRCLGDSSASLGFASTPDSGVGLLGATTAASGYSGGDGTPFGDALFEVWLRGVLTSVNRSQLSTGTAIATMQVRRSAMDVAVGAEAELSEGRREEFDVLYAAPMGRADVILAVPDGTTIPRGLADDLASALADAGWDPPASTPGTVPEPAALLATRDFWRKL